MGLASGRVAVVTGGGSGIGRATALLFAEEGASAVAVSDLVGEAANETAEMISALGVPSFGVAMDVTSSQDIERFIDSAAERYGSIASAVNCAGINGPLRPIGEYSDDDWDNVINVNLNGIFRCMRAEVRKMPADVGASIVNISSGSSVDPIPNMTAYSTSKRGILALTRAAAGEYVRSGIRINAVLPGATLTRMLEDHAKTEQGQQQIANHPMQRYGDPREIAEVAVWLCSPRASYVTGVELLVDGGSHAFWY